MIKNTTIKRKCLKHKIYITLFYDCGSECRGFESHRAPFKITPVNYRFTGVIFY